MIFNVRLFWRLTLRSFYRSGGTFGPLNRDRFIFLVLFYPIWGCLLLAAWIGFLLDEIFFSAYWEQQIEKPLFIVSNFRSGSTFVQRTLARDESTFTCLRTGDIYLMPSITQRRVFSLLSHIDRLLGRIFEKTLRRLDRISLGRLNIHPFGLFDPEEDEHLFFYVWSTFFAGFVFPYLDELPPYQYFDTEIPRAERERLMAFYRRCIQRHMYSKGGCFYLAKNPLFSARIESLLETFPDARIVYLVRNPLEMLPSTISLFSYMWRLFSDPDEKYPHREEILRWTQYWYDHPLEVIDRTSPGQSMIVRYDDLMQTPDIVFRSIYSRFGYPRSEQLETILRDAAAEAQAHTSSHEYSYEAMGFTREQIVREFAHIFARFDFDTREAPEERFVESSVV
ncbi:MAG TPA: sulfotransferase [Terracidiphilus sp.]|nr:sulfotransferase [Terracidiphilus sp.]